MSDDYTLPMADKMEMLRTALPKGATAGAIEIPKTKLSTEPPIETWPYQPRTFQADSARPTLTGVPIPDIPDLSQSDGIPHSWRIKIGGGTLSVEVKGGKVSTQGAFGELSAVEVPDTTLTVADGHKVYLKVKRVAATREIDGIPTILSGLIIPNSSQTSQYAELGQVSVTDGVVSLEKQTRFEDFSIFEDLAVLNGEFQLAPLLMFGKKPYDLPPP